MQDNINELMEIIQKSKSEIKKVIIGQDDVIDYALITVFTGNHLLIEGVPGVAKTLLVRTIAHVLGCDFGRIQFTPDLMPTDITGTNVYNIKKNEFSLVKGPLFTTFLLADEINRSPAKTQSALLQAMQEKQVTIDNETLELSKNFTVFATQNPIEFEGTYPLPEAQKDRFMLKANMHHPMENEELALAKSTIEGNTPENILNSGDVKAVIKEKDLEKFRKTINHVLIREELISYLVEIVRKTREHQSIMIGAGPRATQGLALAAMSLAVFEGRDYVSPDDIKVMAKPVLEHRLILRPEYEIEGLKISEVINDILQDTTVPR